MSASLPALEDRGPAPVPVNDLWEWIQQGFRINRSATAFIAVQERPDHLSYLLSGAAKSSSTKQKACLEWTFDEVEAAALSLASFLHKHGVRREDVVSTFVTNSLEWVVALLASIRLGVIFAPLDLRELTHSEMLQYQMKCAGTNVVIVLNEATAHTFDDYVDKFIPIKLRVIFSQTENAPEGWNTLSNISTGVDSTKLPSTSDQRATDICTIGFTSGTTSLPKGVAWPIQHSVYVHHSKRTTDRPGYNPSARFVLNTTNFRFLMRVTLFDAWRCGASAVLPGPVFEPESLLRAIKEYDCTHMYAIHTQLRMMSSLANFENLRPKSTRYVITNGDLAEFGSIQKIKHDFRAEIVESAWGMTEASGVYYTDDIPPPFSFEGLVCVGTPLPGTAAKICLDDGEIVPATPESRRPLQRGDDGCLHISGPGVVNNYMHGRNPEAFYDDESGRRWIITGDTARMDEQGRIYVVGRSKDVIKCKGICLSPAAFESVLVGLPEIKQVSVFGIPRQLEGSVPVAVVECREDQSCPSLEVLNSALRATRAEEYTLAEVYELHDLGLNSWPIGATDKIMKKDLRDAVLRQA